MPNKDAGQGATARINDTTYIVKEKVFGYSDDRDKQVAGASGDVTAHLVDICVAKCCKADCQSSSSVLTSYFALINDADSCAAFTVTLQDASTNQLISESSPVLGYKKKISMKSRLNPGIHAVVVQVKHNL